MSNTQIQNPISVRVNDHFWKHYIEVVRDGVIPYQWEVLNDRVPGAAPSHAIENFKIAAGLADGEFYGMVFQDSDVAKWLEAVAFSLEGYPNPELEATADGVIDLLGKAQQDDGYLNTYFIIKDHKGRWKNLRDKHELYCAGHLIEAAVAYFQATGKRKFLDIMCRYADHIDSVFGKEESKLSGYPGHQEIELALVKLYRVTGNDKYLKLSKYFIDERGQKPHYFDLEKEARGDHDKHWWHDEQGPYSYHQAHLPVREQTDAIGHAVRAMYMYTAIADLALETGDETLKETCKTLWQNVTQRQMYVTGGVGSTHIGEAFSFDYDLPNDTCYTETCASIGLVFWANRMLNLEIDGKYGDVLERALYNGTICGMDLEGKKFFYVNPLEVWPEASQKRKDIRHVKPVRQSWYSCACCPPNLARLIASVGHYIYSKKDNDIFVHLYIGNETEFELNDQRVSLVQKTKYPSDELVELTVNPEKQSELTLAFRIPGWCKAANIKVNGETINLDSCSKHGYAYIQRTWKQNDQVELYFPMPVEKVRSHPNVRKNAGKVALQRGPLVYCLEEADNGKGLRNISMGDYSNLEAHFEEDILGGVTVITGDAERVDDTSWNEELYGTEKCGSLPVKIKAIPYYAWCNRDAGEMLVWVNEKS